MSQRLAVILVAFAFLFVLVGTVHATPVKLEYNLDKGDVTKYQIKMISNTSLGYQGKIDKIDTESNLTMTQRVVDKDEKTGVMYMLTAIEDVKTTVNGLPSDPETAKAAERVFTMHIRKNGEIVDAQGLQSDMSMQQMQLSFPDKPVDVGSTWDHTIAANDKVKVPLYMKYEVTGFKKVDGVDCIVIKSSVVSKAQDKVEGTDSLDVKADGEIFFDHSTGKIIHNSVKGNFGSVSIQEINGKPEPVVTKVEIKLQMKLVK